MIGAIALACAVLGSFPRNPHPATTSATPATVNAMPALCCHVNAFLCPKKRPVASVNKGEEATTGATRDTGP